LDPFKGIYTNYLIGEKEKKTEDIDWHLLVKKKLVNIEANAEKLRSATELLFLNCYSSILGAS